MLQHSSNEPNSVIMAVCNSLLCINGYSYTPRYQHYNNKSDIYYSVTSYYSEKVI